MPERVDGNPENLVTDLDVALGCHVSVEVLCDRVRSS
jgi:hypothetical protein